MRKYSATTKAAFCRLATVAPGSALRAWRQKATKLQTLHRFVATWLPRPSIWHENCHTSAVNRTPFIHYPGRIQIRPSSPFIHVIDHPVLFACFVIPPENAGIISGWRTAASRSAFPLRLSPGMGGALVTPPCCTQSSRMGVFSKWTEQSSAASRWSLGRVTDRRSNRGAGRTESRSGEYWPAAGKIGGGQCR